MERFNKQERRELHRKTDPAVRENICHAFLVIAGICFLSLLSLIRADYLYKDDIGRLRSGYFSWEGSSRYLSNYLELILSTSTKARELSPVSQGIAALLLAGSCTILIRSFRKDKKIGWKDITAVLPLALMPYFLECYSFKYDSPFMALSVFFSVLPLLFIDLKCWRYMVLTFLCTLGVCTTYQSSTGVFPIVVLFMAYGMWSSGKRSMRMSLHFVGISAVSYLAGLAFYRIVLVKQVADYSNAAILSPLKEMPGVIVNNISTYYQTVYQDFAPIAFWLMAVLAVLGLIGMVTSSVRGKVLSLFMALVTVFLSGVMIHGIFTVIPDVKHIPRYMSAFGIFPAMLCLHAVHGKYVRVAAKWLTPVLAWCFLVYAMIYGNSLAEHGRYHANQMYQLVWDLDHLEVLQQDKDVKMWRTGRMRYATTAHAPQNTLIRKLIPGDKWPMRRLSGYYDLDNMRFEERGPLPEEDLPLLVDTAAYQIYGNDEYILVQWQ